MAVLLLGEVGLDPSEVLDQEHLCDSDKDSSVLHEQSEPKQVVDLFLNDAVLHRLGDFLSRLVREPLVGTPGVDGSDLVVALLRHCNDVVA